VCRLTAVIVVAGWDKFQHYKDRDPPWIKLYRDLFTSESWVLGTDTSRLVQLASLLLAARYQNATPYQWTLVRKVANLDCTEKQFNEAVAHLVSTKFLEIQQVAVAGEASAQSASKLLATCTSETEGEKRREETEKIKSARARPAKRCPEEFQLDEELRTWAAEHFPDVSVERETAAFRDHEYRSAKTDWRAAWRTWIRNAANFAKPNGAGKSKPKFVAPPDDPLETLAHA
jgi:hypothetical protein